MNFHPKNLLVLFVFSLPLVYGLSEVLLVVMAIFGLYYAKKDGYFFFIEKLDWHHSSTLSLLLVPLFFSSVFFIKLASFLWALDARTAVNNAFNHVHFLLWPALIPFFRNVKFDIFKSEKFLALLMLILMFWYVAARVFFPMSEDATCFKAGGHACPLLGQTLAFYLIWIFIILTRVDLTLKNKIYFGLAWIAGWVAFAGTLRRAELLVVIASMAILIIVRFRNRIHKSTFYGVITLALLLSMSAFNFVGERFKEIEREVTMYMDVETRAEALKTSVGGRLEMYRVGVEAVKEKPLLGWGAGARPKNFPQFATDSNHPLGYSNFHHQLLQPLIEVGIVGLLIILGMVTFLIKETVLGSRAKLNAELAFIFAGLWMVYIFKGFFGVTIGYGHVNALFVFYSAWLWYGLTNTHASPKFSATIPQPKG